MELFAVIMAGGVGARFWPRSKEKTPKQLLKIFGENSLIQETVFRLDGLIKNENIFIITNKIQKKAIKNHLPEIPSQNIIDEPFGKNTAAAIGLASLIIEKKCEDAVMITLPADHIIKEKNEFQKTIRNAAEFAYKSKGLLTIGINPTRPETGYGYIQVDESPLEDSIYKVLTFAEKPNYATAVRFIESGDFLWNSGMFIWRVDSILREIDKYMPELSDGLKVIQPEIDTLKFKKTLTKVYGQLKSISVDYGIMEKSSIVYLISGSFSWSDVGSWEEVFQLSTKDGEGNAIPSCNYTQNSSDSYVYSPKKFVALIGVENLIVIDTKDALLVCKRDQAQAVKNVVDYLKMKKMTKHL
ncbi:MAG: mannose-1-phosphate guanylyltransferase [Ignavibacteriales bacterium]|nr:mannose-1-phosphate guanylyltransferase [Ignavibacteriales bacterium]